MHTLCCPPKRTEPQWLTAVSYPLIPLHHLASLLLPMFPWTDTKQTIHTPISGSAFGETQSRMVILPGPSHFFSFSTLPHRTNPSVATPWESLHGSCWKPDPGGQQHHMTQPTPHWPVSSPKGLGFTSLLLRTGVQAAWLGPVSFRVMVLSYPEE